MIRKKIKVKGEEGVVSSVNILEGTYQVTMPNGNIIERAKNKSED